MTYTCKTYQGENKRYLKSIPYNNLKKIFLDNINYEYTFKSLIDWLDDKNQKLLQQFMIKILSNPNDWTIADLQELFN